MSRSGSGSAADDVVTLARAVGRLLAGSGFARQAEALAALNVSAASPSAGHGDAAGGAATGPGPDPAPPVVEHLPAALCRATGSGQVVALLRAVAPSAPWTRTATYLHAPPSSGFADRYAHATLLGPPDREPTTAGAAAYPGVGEVALGLMLLAPDTHYPPHQHPADEVYLPLTRADWLDPDGGYVPVPAGGLRHHRPWQPHAMRTGAHPLLAAYVWTGDVRTPSRFCPPPLNAPA